jgi:ATP-binding cassette subfamily B protein
LVALILNVGLVVVLVCGAHLSAPSGTLLAFLSYFTIIQNGIMGISKIFVSLSRGVASANRIERVLELDERQTTDHTTDGNKENAVEFQNVNFSYNGKRDNLKDITFAVKHGQTLGIIGATGSGKSTLLNLMMRFYDVGQGAVYVDGEDVRSVEVGKLRQKFGVAFQSDFLMADTVRANIAYGRDISDEALSCAVEAAQAKEFIDGLEGGLDYNLAQKAANLSGGQKQRLLIARALCGQPEILLLDDSSSALDYATDAALRKALHEHYPDTTKIIVAQRVSSIRNADLILVLDDGAVIGKGTHEQLLRDCAEYQLIAEAQMSAEKGGVA